MSSELFLGRYRRLLSGALFLVVPLLLGPAIDAQSILVVAGGGTDDGRPATLASLTYVNDITVDADGNIVFVDTSANRIRRIDAISGLISTIAGGGTTESDGVPASTSSLLDPRSVAFDPNGHLYFSESWRNRVRRIDAITGIVTTVAGIGQSAWGFSGDGGPATLARLGQPEGLAFDTAGNLYICDKFNFRLRLVSAETGVISTIASDISNPSAIVAADRSVVVAHLDRIAYGGRISRLDLDSGNLTTLAGNGNRGYSGDGGPATEATLGSSLGLARDSRGNIVIGDSQANRVRRVDAASGVISTIAGNGDNGSGGDGEPATSVPLSQPHAVTFDPLGNLLIAHRRDSIVPDHLIRRLSVSDGSIRTIAGGGSRGLVGPATSAILGCPSKVAIGPQRAVFFADPCAGLVLRVDRTTGQLTPFAGRGEPGSDGDGGPATAAAISPVSIAFDRDRTLYIADRTHRIRAVDLASGTISTVAGNGTKGFSGDGGPALEASFDTPVDLVVDTQGNLFVADSLNRRVRRIDATSKTITTCAGSGKWGFAGDGGPATQASVNWPMSLAIDAKGDLIVGDTSYIRKVDRTTGIITKILGPEVGLNFVKGLAVRRDGAIVTSTNNVVISIDATTLALHLEAGSGSLGTGGDFGPATRASLTYPAGIGLDPANGDLYIPSDNRIRLVPACIPIAAVTLSSPAPGSSGVETSPRLAWAAVERAFRYDVYLDTSNPPARIAEMDLTTPSYNAANLEPATTYYWRIEAKGDPYCASRAKSTSEVWSFTTTNTCEAPGTFQGATKQMQVGSTNR